MNLSKGIRKKVFGKKGSVNLLNQIKKCLFDWCLLLGDNGDVDAFVRWCKEEEEVSKCGE